MTREEVLTALAAAIQEDHPSSTCTNNTCDITRAADDGFTLVAAHLLLGATNTEAIDKVIGGSDLAATMLGELLAPTSPQWREWVEYVRSNTVRCSECEARVWTEEDTLCGACGSAVTVPSGGEEKTIGPMTSEEFVAWLESFDPTPTPTIEEGL